MKANQSYTNANNAYSAILMDEYLSSAFIQACDLIKSKTTPARNVTMQFLQMFECRQYTNPDFVIELYELLTDAKQRNYLLKGIKGK